MDTFSYASTLPLVEAPTRCLWAISGDDPAKVSATQVAQRMNIRMTQPHLVWNPLDGELVRMIPVTHENRYLYPGRKMFTVLVVSQDVPVFTDYPDQNLTEVLGDLPGTIPNIWPMGPPDSLGLSVAGPVDTPGHYTLDQVSHMGLPVGRIDIRRLRRSE